MRRKCRNCLCRTCINVCCDGRNCLGKKRECKKYCEFRQQSIFDAPQKRYQKAPRHSWQHYGITKQRRRELTDMIRSREYVSLASSAAHTANENISEYILLSVMKKHSYEGVEYAEGLGRIPCGRTDFYGYRRYFYYLFDKELRRIGK